MLFIGLRLYSSWTVAVDSGKPVPSFLQPLQNCSKQQYTTHKRSVETAEQCRLSWLHMLNLLACLDESRAGNSHRARSLCSVVLSTIKIMCYGGRFHTNLLAALQRHILVWLHRWRLRVLVACGGTLGVKSMTWIWHCGAEPATRLPSLESRTVLHTFMPMSQLLSLTVLHCTQQ